MIKSSMRRGLAWMLAAATVLSSAPVSAEGLITSEKNVAVADVTDGEETAEEAVELEEDTAAEDEILEEDAEVTVDTASEDEAEEVILDEITENELIEDEVTDDFSDGQEEYGILDENSILSLASESDNVSAPYSSVEKGQLTDGTYTKATVNVFVAGEDNTVLGVNAFMTNPKNPAAFGTSNYGIPNEPVYENATLNIENGIPTVTVELVNPVFQAYKIANAENATVIDSKTEYETDLSSDYGHRITKVTIQLNDYSGLYKFTDCIEYGTPLNDGNPETDDRWYVPLYVAVDFEELLPTSTMSSEKWLDQTEGAGLYGRGDNIANTTLKLEQVTSGDVYDQYTQILENNSAKTGYNPKKERLDWNDQFILYKVSLLDSDGNEIQQTKKDSFTFLMDSLNYKGYESLGVSADKNIQVYQVKDGALVKLDTESPGPQYGKSGEKFYSTRIFKNVSLGYVIVCTNQYNIKCEKTYTDDLLDLKLDFYSDESAESNQADPLNTSPANAATLNAAKLVTKKYDEDCNAEAVLKAIEDEQADTENGFIVEASYGIWLESLNKTEMPYLHSERFNNAEDLTLPLSDVNDDDYLCYLITMNADGTCDSVVKKETTVVDDQHIKIRIYDYEDRTMSPETMYAGATGDTTLTDGQYSYITIVRKIKSTDKPVSNNNLIYNGSKQIGVPEGTGYTLTGATATDAGTYTATATLSKGYVWADGSTDPVTLTWEIARKTAVAKPIAKSGLVYNGAKQSAVAEGEGYNLTGTKEATDPGSYKVNVILSPNYAWPDGSTDNLSLNWTIAKADQNISAKTAAKSYKLNTVKSKKQTFSIGASAEGKVSYAVTGTPSSKAKKYISVSKDGKVTLKKGAPAGTYTVTISAAETATSKAGTKTVTITVNKNKQTIKAKVAKKTLKVKNLKKKKSTFSIGAKAKGKLSYAVSSTPSNAKKYISVSKNGKVTLKKGAPKGTYKITVTAKATSTYEKATKTVTINVK